MLKLILRLMGWKADPKLPEGVDRCIMVAAPHTSNWDAFFMLAACIVLGVKIRFAIKKEWLRFPMGLLFRRLGAIGVDRGAKTTGTERVSTVTAMAELFEKHEKLTIVVAPEGSRGYRQDWRTGFYHTAVLANVPIAFGYLNYATKTAGVGGIYHPTGDTETDMAAIKTFYKDIVPKHPDRFNID